MLEKLPKDPNKAPSPNRSEIMSLLVDSEKAITIDANAAFKSNWITNSLDGTEGFFVSDKIFGLVGDSMREFRNKMTAKHYRKLLKKLLMHLFHQKV